MRYHILLIAYVLKTTATLAQTPFTDTATKKPIYINPQKQNLKQRKHMPWSFQFTTGAGLLWAKNATLNQSFSFNYVSTIANPAAQTINVTKNNYVGTNSINANYFGILFVAGKFYTELIEGGFYASRHEHDKVSGFQLQFGSGATIPIKHSPFSLQAGVNLYYFSSGFSLAQLNNTNATIAVFGQEAQPTFYHHDSSKNGYNGTVNSTQLDIDYIYTQTYLAPKIGISSNLFHSRFSFGICAQYNIPLHQSSNISLTQEGNVPDRGGYNNNLADVSLNNSSLSVYTNGRHSTSVPYTAKGLSLTCTIGCIVSSNPPFKHHKAKTKKTT